MQQPPGFDSTTKSLVCKLHKAIYALKQAPRAWFDRLKDQLLQLGFHSSKCYPSLFVYSKTLSIVYMLIYVNDIIIIGNNLASLQQLVTKFHHAFSLTDLSVLDYVLGVEVKQQHDGSIILTKAKYIWDLLSKKNMSEAKPISSLMVMGCKLTK